MAKASRFASLFETELVKLSESKDSKNTKAATKHSVKLFRTYLAEKGHDSSFETYTNGVLNSRLRLFYAEVRNAPGERYKRTSLKAIRMEYAGTCVILQCSNNIDITRDVDFKEVNDMFVCMCKDTCKTGGDSKSDNTLLIALCSGILALLVMIVVSVSIWMWATGRCQSKIGPNTEKGGNAHQDICMHNGMPPPAYTIN